VTASRTTGDGRTPASAGAGTPAISVVIPTKNRRRLLLRTLRTVRAQRGVDLEVVIVDDGSSDGSGDAVLALGDPRITVVRNERSGGVSAARNTGLERARAPWVAFLDDDDLWAPDKLAAQLAVAADEGAGWVCGGAVTVDRALRIVSGQMPPSHEVLWQLPAFNSVPGGGSGTVARTDLVRQVGGFDPVLSNIADWDLWIRLAAEAPLAAVPRPLTAYLRHPTSLSHDLTSVRDEFEHARRKHAGAREARGLAASSRTLEWFVHRQVQAGNRRAAARAYADLWRRYDSRKSLRWAAVSLVSPGALRRRRDREGLRRLPPWWLEEAERWLAPLRDQPATGEAVPLDESLSTSP
jgi:glycosyltransferase involved in cell wall biosynthesis